MLRAAIAGVRSIFYDMRKHIVPELVLNVVAGSPLVPRVVRYAIYRACGMRLQTYNIRSGCVFKTSKVAIGKETFVNHRCFFDDLDTIEIGQYCAVGPEVMFCTSTHEIGGPERRAGALKSGSIVVGDGCWIGARAVILPGVTVGEGCIIAAGAVVTKDCDPHGLYAGVPARRVRDLPLKEQPAGARASRRQAEPPSEEGSGRSAP